MTERVRARVFGEVAGEYDRIRPGYPPELVDDVLDYARPDGRPVLEVGAGTGKATAAFAARGVRVTALEPDPAMLDVLHARLPEVPTVLSGFEDYSPTGKYALVYSAQAWHWVDPVRGWGLAVDALEPGGALALFWNVDMPADPTELDVILRLHREYVPDIEFQADFGPLDDAAADERWQELVARPEFTDHQRRVYSWQRELSTVDLVALLDTVSAYRLLDPAARDALYAALLAELPERLALRMGTVLYLARPR